MTTIKIIENGPAIINDPTDGLISVITPDGKQENTETKTVAICRCGKSKNQPYCDGSHKSNEPFVDKLKDLQIIYNKIQAGIPLTDDEKNFYK